MIDRDPADDPGSRDRGPRQGGSRHDGSPQGRAPRQPPGTPLGDRWWWSPTLSLALGLLVVGYQLDTLAGPDAMGLNWVVAVLGLAVAGFGAVRLLQAYRSR